MAKKKKKSSRSKPRFQWLRNIEWSNVKRGSMAFAWLLGIGAIAALCWYGVPRLQAHAQTHVDDQVPELVFVDPPAWVQGELKTQLYRTVRPWLTHDPFSRESLVAVREELRSTGWFESVDQVRRVRTDRIEVTGEFVDPYAVVRDRDGDHLVDPAGKLLPLTFPQGEAEQFTVITGARFSRPMRPGMHWEGADISAALRLLQLIEPQPWSHQVEAINITGVIRGEAIRLVTQHGARIIWGSAPGEEDALEALADRKLYSLNYMYDNYGSIDMNRTGTLDITSPTSVNETDL